MPAGGSNQKTIYSRSDQAGTINIRLNSTGTLGIYLQNTLIGTTATTLSLDTWYWIGIRVVTGSSVEWLQIDGVDAGVVGSATVTTIHSNFGFFDASGPQAAADAYWDDILLDNASFVAPSKIVTLSPISDNARATLWTGGAGGTTSLFEAVNNEPPVGTATETNTTQIEHAGGAAGTTDAYDANMTSYSTAGIAAADTVTALQYSIIHGEDINTGTKLLNFSIVSNPTQASGIANFAAGADAGALGTFPSTWTRAQNTLVESPAVTKGTSPVMRVVRPETASRVASVCYMEIAVAYQEAIVVPYVPRVHPYRQVMVQ